MLLHLLSYILRYNCSSLIVKFPKIPLELSPVCLMNFLSLIIRSAAQVPFISLPFLKNISRRTAAELSHPWGLETFLTMMVSDGKSAVNPIMVPPCVMCHFCLGGFNFPWLVWWCSWYGWAWFSKMYSSVPWMGKFMDFKKFRARSGTYFFQHGDSSLLSFSFGS